MRAAAKRARAAATDLSAGEAPIGNDIAAFEGRLLEVRAEVNQATEAGDDLAKGRRERLAGPAEEANKLYDAAAKRIEAGAMGEEKAVLDQVKAAYHPLGDADREIAACGNRLSADVTRTRGKLDHLQDRLARIRASLAPAAEADSMGLSNAAARIESDVTSSEKSLQSLQELAGNAQQCAAQARERSGRNAAAQLCAARNATLAKYNPQTGQAEMRLRQEAGIEPKQNGVRHTAGPTAGEEPLRAACNSHTAFSSGSNATNLNAVAPRDGLGTRAARPA